MKLPRSFLFTLLIIVIGVSALIYVTRLADYPVTQAILWVRSGQATISRAASAQPETVDAGKQTPINPQDSIYMSGEGVLVFVGAQTWLDSGTHLEVTHYGASGSEARIDLTLKAGQTWQTVDGYHDGRSHYQLTSVAGSVITQDGAWIALVNDNDEMQAGIASGEAVATKNGRSVTLKQNEGITLSPEEPISEPAPWSRVRVLTYRADGSTVILPISLQNTKTMARYRFASHQLGIVPEGAYNLTVEALEPYQASDLVLARTMGNETGDAAGDASVNELPVTLSEVVFRTVDAAGSPVSYTVLNIQGRNKVSAVPDVGAVLGSGQWTLIAAREEKPEAVQPVKVDLAPGQRITIVLKNNLFGGGTIQTRVKALDDTLARPVDVVVYQAGSETGNPLLSFKSDGTVQALPEGNYVISVRTPIAERREVSIAQNQSISIDVPLGSLIVNYLDAEGKPVTRAIFVYVASVSNMQRMGLTVDQMRQTPYGRTLRPGEQLLVPAGTYNVLVRDQKDVEQGNILVQAGKPTVVDLKMPQ